jgi:putative addiction module killer protein
MDYSSLVIEILKSDTFNKWLLGLKDRQARVRIGVRLDRMALGNPGDVKPVRDGISEMRVDHGPGYRVYFMQRGHLRIVLLAGGDKTSQDADIERAIKIAKSWKD